MPERLSRRRALQALGAAAAPAIVPSLARAEFITPKSITILVGFTSGGGVDALARTIAPRIESRIGRRVKVENHAGNNGTLVGEALKRGPPDGSLVGCMTSGSIAAKVAVRDFPFDPAVDLTPLSLAGTYPMALAISPRIEVATLNQFAEWLRGGDKTRTRLGVTGSGGFVDLYARLLGRELGTPLEGVGYRGGRPMISDIYENRIPAGVVSMPTALEYHRGGKLKILVTSAEKRLKFAPGLPSAFEVGRANLVMEEWYGLFAAARTPAPVVDAWNAQIRAVLAEPETAAELTNVGIAVQTSTPRELAGRVSSLLKQWQARMTALGMGSPA